MTENKLLKISFSVILFTILIFSLSCFTFAESLNELRQEQAEMETKEESSEIELELVKGELSDLQVEIANLNDDIITLEMEISSLDEKSTSLSNSIKENSSKLETLTEEYTENKDLLDRRLVAMYRAGNTRYLDVLLNSSSVSDFISNYYLIEKVVDADTRLLDTVSEKKSELEEREITLRNQREELSEARESAEKKRVSLSNMSVVKNSYVKKLSKEEKDLQDEITEFQKALKQIESDISAVSLESISPDYIGGDMRWPVPGYSRITSNFGMRVHPITGVYKLHTGVDISAPEGTNFIAAADGVVVKAYYNSAYGNMVMIDHGGGVVTLYAHGSSIEVSVGDTVKQGQTVLKVGHTGYATGPHAHFEIRVNGEYKNPLNYVSSN